MHNIFVNILIN